MENIENPEKNAAEGNKEPENAAERAKREYESLSDKEKFEIVLKLFGTDEARDAFIENCEKYAEARIASARNAYIQNHGENYVSPRDRYSPPKRAHYHNKIMRTLDNLSLHLQKFDLIQEMALKEMRSSRETTWRIMKDWLPSQKGKEIDEEESDEGSDNWLYPSRQIDK